MRVAVFMASFEHMEELPLGHQALKRQHQYHEENAQLFHENENTTVINRLNNKAFGTI